MNELDRRNKINNEKYNEENTYLIQTYDYIKENYKNKLLFYSMNHPTKYLIQFICEKIIDILHIKNTINYHIDPLDGTKCISKNVNFDINDHNALTLGITDVKQIAQLYYNTYNQIGYKYHLYSCIRRFSLVLLMANCKFICFFLMITTLDNMKIHR